MGVFKRQGNGIGGRVKRLEIALIRGHSGRAIPEALPPLQLPPRQQRHHFKHDALQRIVSPATVNSPSLSNQLLIHCQSHSIPTTTTTTTTTKKTINHTDDDNHNNEKW